MALLSVLLAAVFLVAGVGHVLLPRYVASLVPPWIPATRTVVLATGVLDVAVGAALLCPRTRRGAAWAAAVLLTAYVVSHLDAGRRRDPTGPFLTRPYVLVARVGINLGYLAVSLAVALAG